MKKKILNVFLITMLVIIYGKIFLKMFGSSSFNDTISTYELSVLDNKINKPLERIDFDISNVKTDPFRLSTQSSIIQNKKITTTKSLKKSKITDSKYLYWPNFEYYGFVKNQKSKSPLILVKVDSKMIRKREGEVFDNIKIYKVYEDSLILKQGKEKKVVQKIKIF